MAGISGPGAADGSDKFLNFLQSERLRLLDKVAELEAENEELKEEIQEIDAESQHANAGKNMGVMGQIGEAVKNPEFMSMLRDGIYLIRKTLEKPGPAQPQAMAGVKENASDGEKVRAAIETLRVFYTDQAGGDWAKGAEALANDMQLLAQMTANPLDFNYAIAKLRDNFKK
jgi:hypothetical protein